MEVSDVQCNLLVASFSAHFLLSIIQMTRTRNHNVQPILICYYAFFAHICLRPLILIMKYTVLWLMQNVLLICPTKMTVYGLSPRVYESIVRDVMITLSLFLFFKFIPVKRPKRWALNTAFFLSRNFSCKFKFSTVRLY